MVAEPIRSLWAEPRAPDPPGPARRDWGLVAIAVTAAVIEALARPDMVWRPLSLVVVVALAFTLPWRRTHPLLVAAIAFGTTSSIDVAALARGVEWEGLGSAVFLLLLPYAVTRWGSGRAVAAGLVLLSVPLGLTAARGAPVADVVGGAVVVLLAFTLGAGARYHWSSQQQELDGVRSREREQLARELHDTVAHHVSAIAVQAQAGRTMAGKRPEAALEALSVIEGEASRTLAEMRAMVRVLRDGAPAEYAPQPGVADLVSLARRDPVPVVDVELAGDLAGLRLQVDAAVYRLAQEALTNALRHARNASRVEIRVVEGAGRLRLRVTDDGQIDPVRPATHGFGLLGMTERVQLLGGTLRAGPAPGGGWAVDAELPTEIPR